MDILNRQDRQAVIKEIVLPLILLEVTLYLLAAVMGVETYDNMFPYICIVTAIVLFTCKLINANTTTTIGFTFVAILNVGVMIHCVLSDEMPESYGKDATDFMLHIGVSMVAFVLVILLFHFKKNVISLFFSEKGYYIILVLTVGIYALCFVAGRVNGASNWIAIGSLSVQGTELCKLAYFWILAVIAETIETDKRLIIKLLILYGVNMIFLILASELGTLIVITIVSVIVLAVSVDEKRVVLESIRKPIRVIAIVFICILLIGILVMVFESIVGGGLVTSILEKVRSRFLGFLFPEQYALTYGYQSTVVSTSIFSGGLFGSSGEEIMAIPVASSDMVFAVIVFKMGVLFGIAVISLYTVLFIEGLRTSIRKDSPFIFTFVTGLIVQVIYSIGCVIGILPISGLTLCFISSGGTSLACSTIMMAIIMVASGNNFDVKGVIKNEKEKDENSYVDNDHFDDFIVGDFGNKIRRNPWAIPSYRFCETRTGRKEKRRKNDYWGNN